MPAPFILRKGSSNDDPTQVDKPQQSYQERVEEAQAAAFERDRRMDRHLAVTRLRVIRQQLPSLEAERDGILARYPDLADES